jgi:hypothetical protein
MKKVATAVINKLIITATTTAAVETEDVSDLGLLRTKGEEELEGLSPNGQKSPPLGGRIHVREFPSLMLTKFVCRVRFLTVWGSTMNGAEAGTVSAVLQLGPRALMKEVFPSKTFAWTTKFCAEETATP